MLKIGEIGYQMSDFRLSKTTFGSLGTAKLTLLKKFCHVLTYHVPLGLVLWSSSTKSLPWHSMWMAVSGNVNQVDRGGRNNV